MKTLIGFIIAISTQISFADQIAADYFVFPAGTQWEYTALWPTPAGNWYGKVVTVKKSAALDGTNGEVFHWTVGPRFGNLNPENINVYKVQEDTVTLVKNFNSIRGDIQKRNRLTLFLPSVQNTTQIAKINLESKGLAGDINFRFICSFYPTTEISGTIFSNVIQMIEIDLTSDNGIGSNVTWYAKGIGLVREEDWAIELPDQKTTGIQGFKLIKKKDTRLESD